MSAPRENVFENRGFEDGVSEDGVSEDCVSEDRADELGGVLRERFRQAVSAVEPTPGTLEYLRRAVPARRRKRHAALAATAVSVFAVSAGATLAARGSFDSTGSSQAGTTVGNLLTTGTNGAPGGGSGHGPETPGGRDLSGGSLGAAQPTFPASAPGTSKPPLSTTAPTATLGGDPVAPLCQNSSVTALTATSNGTTGGVTYETFQGTAKAACVLNGMPGLLVTGADGAPARIPVYPADSSAAPLLPAVAPVQELVLQPGEQFEFQLAWVPAGCSTNPPPTVPSSSGSASGPTTAATTAGPTPTGGPTTVSSSQPTPSGTPSSSPGASIYSVAYAVSGSQAVQSVSLRADCGATIYVTDYFPTPGQQSMGNAPTAATSSD